MMRKLICAVGLLALLAVPAYAGTKFTDVPDGVSLQNTDLLPVARQNGVGGCSSPGGCSVSVKPSYIRTNVYANAPGTNAQVCYNNAGNLTTGSAATIKALLAITTGDVSGYVAPVNADWNASTGLAQILNKPTIGTAGGKAASDNTKSTLASVSGSITSGHVCTFADTSGTLQDGGVLTTSIISEGSNLYYTNARADARVNALLGNVSNVAQIPLTYLDTDVDLTANSDSKVASQKAVKAYIDSHTGAALAGLSDVDLGTLADGDVLMYVDADGKWENSPLAAVATSGLASDLTNDENWIDSAGAPVQSVAGRTGTIVLAKADVGLGSVDNVQQMPLTYLDTDGTMAANSDSLVASQKAVKTYADTKVPSTRTVNGHALSANVTVTASDVGLGSVDNVQQLPASYLDVDGTLAANSDSKVASQKATKTYADTKVPSTRTVAGKALSSNITIACGDLSNGAASCSTDTSNASNISSGTLAAARGGAGTVNGIMKANGSGAVSAAVSGTDYAPATSGSAILKGNGSGGFSSASAGTDYESPLTFSTGLSRSTNTVSVSANHQIRQFGITIDGGGSTPSTGAKPGITISYAGTIVGWYITADTSCSAVLDIKRSGTSIIGGSGNKPTLSSASSANAAPSSWTSTSVSANDNFTYNLDSVSGCGWINVVFKVNAST